MLSGNMGSTGHPHPHLHPQPVLGLRTGVRASSHPSSTFPPLRKPIVGICLDHCFWTGHDTHSDGQGAQGLLSPIALPDNGLAPSEPPGQLVKNSDPWILLLRVWRHELGVRLGCQHGFQKTQGSFRGSALLPRRSGDFKNKNQPSPRGT